MKKILLFILGVTISIVSYSQEVKKVALLEPRTGDGSTSVTGMEKAMIRGELRKAIVSMTGYEAITRADIDQMMKEQDFQRTGMVNDAQIKKMGEMSGADYICVSTLTKSNSEFYLEAYLIHLETGRMSNPASQYGELVDGKLANMLPVCQILAKELLGVDSDKNIKKEPSPVPGPSVASNAQPKQVIKESPNKPIAEKKEVQKAKEEKRLADERARQEREAAKAKALEEKQLEKERAEAEEKRIREERAAAEEKARQERAAAEEKARQERAAAEEKARQERLLAEEKARQEREAAAAAELERKRQEEERKAAEEAERLKYSITKVSKNEYRLGNTTMDRKAYEQFIYQNCPDAWKKHVAAKRTIITGWTFLGVGAALSSAWAMLPLADYYYEGRDDTYYITWQTLDEWYLTGTIVGSIGAALVATSIPLLSAGYSIKYNTHKRYNKSCATANKSLLTLNLQAGPNGLGVALKF